MLGFLFRRIFGSVNDRFIKSLDKDIKLINSFEEQLSKLTDEELAGYTNIFKEKLAEGLSIEDILHESFAVVREASKRVLGMRHFDVQLMGGIVLHRGMVSEMRTGEGKTLVCTLPAYLNALTGKGVHVVTTNDYLVRRDAAWMGKIYNFLGLTIGCIVPGLNENEREEAYNADITYATNNELGFDFLRDNMKMSEKLQVQRPFNYAILDEADSILIDEARTPLIISGPTEDNSQLYYKIDKIIPHLDDSSYEIDEKAKAVNLTDRGISKLEELLIKDGLVALGGNLYDIENVTILHHINQALKAHKLFAKDVDYMIKDNKVVIIDEFTGRMMEGRRYSDGLHQALEAKENVEIQNENQTLASITFQNYFRMYPKLAGMTGTAMTEANEFREVYKLEVVEIPTNITVARIDEDDEIYRTAEEKLSAIIKRIEEAHKNMQPVLVGTVSIEKSELLSKMLKKHKIKHQVLNAKYHEQEAEIIAQAGRSGGVTIATNMAGRGTDIKLGGNAEMLFKEQAVNITDPEKLSALEAKIISEVAADKSKVLASGGLLVIGTERHESRRIDNQLRGRCGRQGDPGKTIFFLSLEDDLMRIFASEKMGSLLQRLGLKDGEAITHPLISKALEKAQQRVEAHNYEIRKNLLKFDDVMNDQRQVIYKERKEIMQADNIGEIVSSLREALNHDLMKLYIPKAAYREEWDLKGLEKAIYHHYMINIDLTSNELSEDEILDKINEETDNLFKKKEELYGLENMRMLEKRLFIVTMDGLWKDHLHALDHLRQGINLRAYGQKDPLSEYKREAFNLFSSMLDNLQETFITNLALARIVMPNEETSLENKLAKLNVKVKTIESRQDVNQKMPLELEAKVGRNEQCPCGSGKKYKHCHGAVT